MNYKETLEEFMIPCFPNYRITKCGKIFSYKSGKRKLLKQHNHRGYRRLSLSRDNKSKMYLVHRLVAITFIENPNKFKCVNHKDGNKCNNRVSNLEWIDHSDNMKHAGANNLMNPWQTTGENTPNAKLTKDVILTIRDMYSNGISQFDIASLFQIKRGNIWAIVNRKTWKNI